MTILSDSAMTRHLSIHPSQCLKLGGLALGVGLLLCDVVSMILTRLYLESKRGVGISVPSKFDPHRDMVTIHRDENATGLSISKFEVKSRSNAILILIEPEDER